MIPLRFYIQVVNFLTDIPHAGLSMPPKKTKKTPGPIPANPSEDYWEEKQNLENKGKKLFIQKIFEDWCKRCGICIAFCPASVFDKSKSGLPVIKDPDACTGCRFCEIHCPDFALSIQERYPDRRKKNGQ
jgi:2-oxoglutarate ferredoxin oxidoreductase subunit delta